MIPQEIFSQEFIINNYCDTIFFSKLLPIEDGDMCNGRNERIKKFFDKTSNIRCLQLKHNFYVVVNHRFWKRVVHGKINVYALQDADSIANRNGRIRKSLLIQVGDQGALMVYTHKALQAILNPSEVTLEENQVLQKLRASRVLQMAGAGIGGSAAAGFIIQFMLSFGNDSKELLMLYSTQDRFVQSNNSNIHLI
jgi:hypothetical protein